MNKFLHKILEFTKHDFIKNIYKYLQIIYSIIFFVSFIGITLINEKYVHMLSTLIHIYVGTMLVIHFNPYIKDTGSKQDKAYDRRMAYSAGILLLLSTTISEVFQKYLKKYIHQYTSVKLF